MSSFVDPLSTRKPLRNANGQFARNPNNTNPPRKRKPKVKQSQNAAHSLIQNMVAAPPPVQAVCKTFYTIVLDCSGSMRSVRAATVNAFNTRIEVLKNLAQQHQQDVYISLLTFGSRVYPNQYTNVPLNQIVPLTVKNYDPDDGSTCLLDGVGYAIEDAKRAIKGPNDAFLIEIITDGGENSSVKYSDGRNNFTWGRTQYNKISLPALIDECHRTGYYTIVFQVPPGAKNTLHQGFNIPLDNINEWEATQSGTVEATQRTVGGLANYMSARASGAKSLSTFYQKVDLSQVSARDLQKCTDISHQFRMLSVDKECAIKEFVESKTGKPFVIGSAYYQLTKEELIQPTKDVAIMEKGKTTVWGGQEARKLLGLVPGANNKVDPFNLSKYVVFVKSTSVNRILVRGSRVLFDYSRNYHEAPTWGKIDANNMFTV